MNLLNISQQLLLAAKTKSATTSLVQLLHTFPATALQEQLVTDNDKKAFWINIYNAYTQIILSANSYKYKKRNRFFKEEQIYIAGKRLSLDDIEHGILRRSKVKWSFGYLNKLFPSAFEKAHRVQHVDYRIHFALNCGAASCPPVGFYDVAKLNQQLDLAAKAYLSAESEYKEEKNRIYLPAVMSWFRGDFGGKKNMIVILKQYGIISQDKNPRLKFKRYNWQLFLANYTDN